MLTTEERLLAGLKALEKFTLISTENTTLKPNQDSETDLTELNKSLILETIDPPLKGLIDRFGPFPSPSAVLGTCEDGLPFLVDLNNPVAGSILIVGDPGSRKNRLLKSIVSSLGLINTPAQVSYFLSTSDPGEFRTLARLPGCSGLKKNRSAETALLISQLLTIAEERQWHNDRQPVLVLVIDDLSDFIHGLNDDAYFGFDWLVRHGPQRRIWVVASQSTDSLGWIDEELIEAFSTPILGRITSTEIIHRLSDGWQNELPKPTDNNTFFVPYEDSWIQISVCIAE